MKGFFSAAELPVLNNAVALLVPKCDACGLYKAGCQSPKMLPSGRGRKNILLVAEAPGADEDRAGRQFVGKSGEYLRKTLAKLGVDMREDCWLTNSVICRPPNNDLTKYPRAVAFCRPNLLTAVKKFDPEIIIPMGGKAVEGLIGHLYKDEGNISSWAGFRIPDRRINSWVCPTFHPSHILHTEDRRGNYDPILERLFREHLGEAVKLKGRPWPDSSPDYAAEVEVVQDIAKAAAVVREMHRRGGVVSFDFETNMLKPDHPRRRVVCCAVCWQGKKTIAFPWHGEVRQAVKNLLVDPAVGKIGANIKFETRWAYADLGVWVQGWVFDTVTAAHTLFNCDRGRKVASVKFQGYAHLGVGDYDSHVKPYLKSKDRGGYAANRVGEVPLPTLLKYCGTDALLEYQIAEVQAHLLGVKL